MSTPTRHYLLPALLVLLLLLLISALLTCFQQSRALKTERVYRELYTRTLCEQAETYLIKTVAEYGVDPSEVKIQGGINGPSSFSLSCVCCTGEGLHKRLLAAVPYMTQELYALGVCNENYRTVLAVQMSEQSVPSGRGSAQVPGLVIQVKFEGVKPAAEVPAPVPYSYTRAAEHLHTLHGLTDKMQNAADVQQYGVDYLNTCRAFLDEYLRLFDLDVRNANAGTGYSLKFRNEYQTELLAVLRAVSRLQECGYHGVPLLQTEEDRAQIRSLERLRWNLEPRGEKDRH